MKFRIIATVVVVVFLIVLTVLFVGHSSPDSQQPDQDAAPSGQVN